MTDREKSQIERINQVSGMARTSWITLLAYLAFVGVTLTAVEDVDFFMPSRQTQLPLIGIAMPTASFFVFAPILAAALYVYLHIILLKLWDAIADVSAERIGDQPLGDALNPWLVNDWALSVKGGAFTPARPLRTIGNVASFLLIWAAAPLVLFGFWWRSMPAHNEWLTLLLALCLLVALHAGVASWRTARAWLAQPRRPLDDRCWRHRDIWYLGTVLACVTLLRTEFPLQVGNLSTLAATDLAGVDMVPLPSDWRRPEAARDAFRKVWCDREGTNMQVCMFAIRAPSTDLARLQEDQHKICQNNGLRDCDKHFADLRARFASAWLEERAITKGNLVRLDLSGRDLRRATADGVSLVGARLAGARLEMADLAFAELEKAVLVEARLENANLSSAGLQGAFLQGAHLEGANLAGAQMEAALLHGAHLDAAILRGANVEGSDLSQAGLQSTEWDSSSLLGASLALGTDFRGATGLTQAQLENVLGDATTLLPVAAPPLHVWTCWNPPSAEFHEVVARQERFVGRGPGDGDANLICGPGTPRQKTGTHCPPEVPRDECPAWAVARRLVEPD